MSIKGNVFRVRLGLPGSGKSLGLVEEDLLPHLLSGSEVYTNFWVNWSKPNLHFFSDISEVLHLRNAVIAFDEIGQVLDPRNWEQESSEVRRFFQLHRHHHLDIFGTTQDISLVAKSALIVVDEWFLCQKLEDGALLEKIFSWFNYGRVRVRVQEMTFQELKKISNGILNLKDPNISDEPEYRGSVEDIRAEELEFEEKYEDKTYSFKKLLHAELNEFKRELYHYYCPDCAGRQLDPIPYDTDITLLTLQTCPKHFCPLIVKPTGLFDTDYDIEVPTREVEWRPFVASPAGHMKIPFKGVLSGAMVSQKQSLPKKLG